VAIAAILNGRNLSSARFCFAGGHRDERLSQSQFLCGMSKRIVIATWGSLGDLYPYLAIALQLQARGDHPVIATNEYFRRKVQQAGLDFAPLGPHLPPDRGADFPELGDLKSGPEFLIRKVLLPPLMQGFDETLAAIRGADVLVTHCVTFGAQIAAEKTGIPWVSTVLAPTSFMSAYDPPILAAHPWLRHLRLLGPAVNRRIMEVGRAQTNPWFDSIREFRRGLHLPAEWNPLFEGQHSPHLVLALYSAAMGARQPDWPPHARITGFPFFEQPWRERALDPEIARFLDSGPPPIVFTLGSAAIYHAGDFFRSSVEAAHQLGQRALLLAGDSPQNHPPQPLPPGTMVAGYAPYAPVFARAAVNVHQGGIGTTAEALRAGRPMLVVPYGFDQPDNAARAGRLGVARVVERRKYDAKRAAHNLKLLLERPKYAAAAAAIAERVRVEDGANAACDAIHEYLRAPAPAQP
jgi:UDP:flavonoid glycosyltransferase YjiC (YdhE family)